jgi:abnormal spindle-like microcephaly-associated protein
MKPRYIYLNQLRVISKIQHLWRQKFEKRMKAVVKIQQWNRSMKQRYAFFKQKHAVIKIQRWTRSMKQRYAYLRQYHAVCQVQKLWRVQLNRRVEAAKIIQKWTCTMKQRYTYLRQHRVICRIQQLWKEKYQLHVKSAILIQKWSRSMKQRYVYLQQYRVICKVQQIWRQKYKKRVEAAILIQKWTRSMNLRFNYLLKRRVICLIQRLWRQKYERRVKAATVIQRHWYLYKTRAELKQKSALLIQNKWRNYKIRQLKCEIWTNTVQNHIKLVHLTKLIYLKQEILSINIKLKQAKREYKAVCTIKKNWQAYKLRKFLKESYERRCSISALKIQLAYRRFKLKEIDSKMNKILNESAKIIQTMWRAFKHRKLNSIKVVKSLTPKKSTIGDRFKSLLDIFQSHNVTRLSISQLVAVLMELHNLTSVSYECCFSFIHSSNVNTIDLLFRFIQSCNRSQPHIDLLNICLKLILNLLKCKSTFKYVVDKLTFKTNRIEQLLGLLKSFYLNNCQLFVNSSVLLMILASNSERCMSYLKNGTSLNVLIKLKELINRRANLKLVSLSENYCKRAIVVALHENRESNEPIMITTNNVVSILKLNFKKPIDSLNYLLVNILKV